VQCFFELAAVRRQLVDGYRRWRLEPALVHDACRLEIAQADRENVRANSRQPVGEIGVALRPGQKVADDEKRPPLADRLKRVRDGTVLRVPLHPHGV
jgi:hypothetical protein